MSLDSLNPIPWITLTRSLLTATLVASALEKSPRGTPYGTSAEAVKLEA